MKTTLPQVFAVTCCVTALLISQSEAFSVSSTARTKSHRHFVVNQLSSSLLNEDLIVTKRRSTTSSSSTNQRKSALSAFTTADDVELIGRLDATSTSSNILDGIDWEGLKSVLTTSLLVTSSTVGAGALVLPELAQKPGLAISTGLFVAAYGVNLISGLVIAEIAIKQHESSPGADVPCSFKDFANANLDSITTTADDGDDIGSISDLVAAICIFTNVCLIAFGLTSAGDIIANLIPGNIVDATITTPAYAAVLAVMMATLSGEAISMVASVTCMALFSSFAGLLIPGLANLTDFGTLFMAPGTSDNVWAGISQVFPIFLISMVYQNIVPSVTKILEYDRVKTIASLTIGSFLPLALHVAWCLCAADGDVAEGPLLTIFSLAAATGSSIGCAMSVAEEVDSYVTTTTTTTTKTTTIPLEEEEAKNNDAFSPLAVVSAVAVPLVASMTLAGGEDFIVALKVAGSYGTPLLYGGIPALMAYTQRHKLPNLTNLVPGGVPTLATLGIASAGFMLHELSTDLTSNL